jgi:hypothetical protein
MTKRRYKEGGKMEVLMCEECGKIYPPNHDGLDCEEQGCNGQLIPVELETPRNNGHGYHIEPQFAS